MLQIEQSKIEETCYSCDSSSVVSNVQQIIHCALGIQRTATHDAAS